MVMTRQILAGWLLLVPVLAGAAELQKESAAVESIAGSHWRFEGTMRQRIEANITNWLLRAPGANPGLIDMFHQRDRHLPYAEPVPWAGEFAGKYLISAVQALRMSDDPKLKSFVASFVNELIACQAEDGYLGPWPKDQRLLGHWDLWGHYHCMLGLLMWHEDTGDAKALECVQRAADCILATYQHGRRPIEAGSPPTNLSVYHIFTILYRRTGDARYLDLIHRIEEDMAQDGDWLRKGEAGVPYYKLPGSGTRWESLHLVQGFLEMWYATGDAKYKKAFVTLWDSIRQYDRHPSGAFSTNEQAFGSVFAKGAIETCCSVAWMALSLDMLRLTGDATVADELEMSTWNQALAGQHPSGNWSTYDTPLNGTRAPSYHQINFQYRPGTPELNCCSVNAPRMWGMLAEWAVMADGDGYRINYYGPNKAVFGRKDGSKLTLVQETAYPVKGDVRLVVTPEKEAEFTLKLRIPAWSKKSSVSVNDKPESDPAPGTYATIKRTWKAGDVVTLHFDMTPRYWQGDGPDRGGCAAIYAGPLLLAFDTYYNEKEVKQLGRIDVSKLQLEPANVDATPRLTSFPPMGLWKTTTDDGAMIQLCDFASAGAQGTEYVAWLPASHIKPTSAMLLWPDDKTVGKPSAMLLSWTPPSESDSKQTLLIAKDAAFKQIVVEKKDLSVNHCVLAKGDLPEGDYFWKVLTVNDMGSVENRGGIRMFSISEKAPELFLSLREDGLMAASLLGGKSTASFGRVSFEKNLRPAPDRKGNPNGAIAFGPDSGLRYQLPFFPERDYAFQAWVCADATSGPLQEIMSAWCAGLDDPLRICLDGDKLAARIEAGNGFGTSATPIKQGEWFHVAAVKQGKTLTLYVNGKSVATGQVPEKIHSRSVEIGLGFNPFFAGGEYFKGKIADFQFWGRALTPEEIQTHAKP